MPYQVFKGFVVYALICTCDLLGSDRLLDYHLGVHPIRISLDIIGYLWISLDMVKYEMISLGYLWAKKNIFSDISKKRYPLKISNRYPDISKYIQATYP